MPRKPSAERLISTESAEETRKLAARLGLLLRAGDVVSLTGDLGAGKTTFTQGLAVGLGIPDDVVVNSPTFTILAEHFEGRVPLYHFDVYRLGGVSDLYDLAFDEYVDGSGVVVVEWADRIRDALPDDTLYVDVEFDSDSLPFTEGEGVGPDSSPSRFGRGGEERAGVGPSSDRLLRFTAFSPRSAELIRSLEVDE